MIKIIKIRCSFYVHVCRKHRYGQFNKKLFVRPCVHVDNVGKVYRINVSIVGRSKEDKKLALLKYMRMRVCI